MNINNRVGLQNFGNTCFMNASIQMLMSASTMAMHMMDNNDISSNRKYVQTYKDYFEPNTRTLGPKIMYVQYMRLNTNYRGFSQEDAHEFLTYTLNDMMENTPNKKALERYMSVGIKQHVHYKKGQDEDSSKDIKETILTFPMDSNITTLNDCYNLFKVTDNDDFTLTLEIDNLPKYLFIGLKRFIYDNGKLSKINKEVEIPFETNMFHNNHTYKLKSFIMHTGGYFGGHYYTYSLRKVDNEYKWFCFNDLNVSEVPIERINDEVKRAYILLYSHRH